MKRIEREAVETLSKASSLYITDDQVPKDDGVRQPTDTTQQSKGKSRMEDGSNNPGAQLWGIGEKSKL